MPALVAPWLGRPGSLVQLPPPNSPIEVTIGRGETVHGLASGGTAVTSRLNEKRSWPLPYEFLPASDADVLRGLYLGLYGRGPFVFVDPTIRNVLGLDVSTCGVRSQAAHGWTQSGGTLTRSGDAPTDAAGSGSLTWASIPNNATLTPTFDTGSAPVVIPGQASTATVWMKAAASVTVALQLTGLNAAGVVGATQAVSVTVGTAWTAKTVTANAGSLGASLFLLPRIVMPGSGVPSSLSIAAAQVEYNDNRTSWQPGNGSPRVVITSSPGRTVQKIGFTDHTFTLAEV